MAEYARRDGVNIFMREIMPAVEQSAGASTAQQTERRPRTSPSATSGCTRLASDNSTIY